MTGCRCVVFGAVDYLLTLFCGFNFDESIVNKLVLSSIQWRKYVSSWCKHVSIIIIDIYHYLYISVGFNYILTSLMTFKLTEVFYFHHAVLVLSNCLILATTFYIDFLEVLSVHGVMFSPFISLPQVISVAWPGTKWVTGRLKSIINNGLCSLKNRLNR